jgi:hypothetical protein
MTRLGLSVGLGANSIAVAQIVKDPPWNPDRIDHLPPEVRSVVLAMCAKSSSAGHYFATYSQNSRLLNLHFEKFHCEQGPAFCTSAGCLHQVYALTAGHYHLVKLLWKRQRLISRSGQEDCATLSAGNWHQRRDQPYNLNRTKRAYARRELSELRHKRWYCICCFAEL